METLTKQRVFVLWVCTLLFALRVLAQPLSQIESFAFLPRFEVWHSGALPYPVLLLLQVMILFIMLRLNARWTRGITTPNLRLGQFLLGLGALYMATMLARLILGWTLIVGHPWFDRPLPTAFHLVLASYMLVLSSLHLRPART